MCCISYWAEVQVGDLEAADEQLYALAEDAEDREAASGDQQALVRSAGVKQNDSAQWRPIISRSRNRERRLVESTATT